jgi:hypothetical protein
MGAPQRALARRQEVSRATPPTLPPLHLRLSSARLPGWVRWPEPERERQWVRCRTQPSWTARTPLLLAM